MRQKMQANCLSLLPSSFATTRRDFRTRRDFFASMGTAFKHGHGLNSRLVAADEDNICLKCDHSCESHIRTYI